MGLFRRALTPSLTAAAGTPSTSSITASVPSPTPNTYSSQGGHGWQAASLDYIDRVPEHSYASGFFGWCLSRIQLRPGIIGDDLEITPLFDDEGKPRDGVDANLATLANTLISNLRSPYGGQAQLLWAMGELIASTGECYLVGTDRVAKVQTSNGEIVDQVIARKWEVLSISEIRPRNDAREGEVPYKRYRTPSSQGEPLPNSSFVLRIHIPHLRYSDLPRSSAQALLSTLEVLDLLTQEAASQARSRLAGPGTLWVPSEIDLPPDPDSPDLEPFTGQMIKAMGTAIGDKSSAAGYVPLVFRGAYQYLDRVQKIDFATSEARTEERRAAKVNDYARGTDLPMEIVTGHAQTTFCVDPATEILTYDGWRKHDEISEGDLVLTLNHVFGFSEWQPLQAIHRFEVENEKMLSIEAKAHNSLSTMGHRWPIIVKHDQSRRWRTTNKLTTNDFVPTAAPCTDLPSETKWSDELVELVAWFYTEGSTDRRNRKEGALAVITQSRKANPDKVVRIRQALFKLIGPPVKSLRNVGVAWREYWDPNHSVARFFLSREFTAHLEVLAPDRRPTSEFIRSLTLAQLNLFINTSMAGDGTVTNMGSKVIAQVDPTKLDGLELACILSGRTPFRWSREGTYNGKPHTMYYLVISDKVRCRLMRSGQNYTHIDYTGLVWCPQTVNQTWLARRNGKVYFTGNSNAWQIDESTAKTHIIPKVMVVCGRLTNGYLQKLLMAARGLDPEVSETPPEIARIAVYPDISNLVVHPNREEVAKWAYGTGIAPNFVISAATARDWIGAGENDAPDEEEEIIRVQRAQELLTRRREEVAGGAPFATDVPATPGPGDIAKGNVSASLNGHGGDRNGTNGANGNGNGLSPTPNSYTLTLQITIALEQAIERAIDRIGARLRDKVKNDAKYGPLTHARPASDIPRILGPDTVSRVIGPQGLFYGEFGAHERLVRRFATQAHHPNPDLLARKSVELAEILTTRRMYEDAVEVDGGVVGQMVAVVR